MRFEKISLLLSYSQCTPNPNSQLSSYKKPKLVYEYLLKEQQSGSYKVVERILYPTGQVRTRTLVKDLPRPEAEHYQFLKEKNKI